MIYCEKLNRENIVMKHYYLEWKKTLNELNDFSCKIEFLQSKLRNNVIYNKNLDIEKYLNSLKTHVKNHTYNLRMISHLADKKLPEKGDEFVISNIRNKLLNV